MNVLSLPQILLILNQLLQLGLKTLQICITNNFALHLLLTSPLVSEVSMSVTMLYLQFRQYLKLFVLCLLYNIQLAE